MRPIAIYPGTFDPITNGHMDIIERGTKLFDKVIVAVAPTNRKQSYLTIEERVTLLNAVLKSMPKVSVARLDGLAVSFARKENAAVILRGLRAVSDFDYEFQLAYMNHRLDAQIETVFLPAAEGVGHISGTIVREIAELGGDVSSFVPAAVAKYLQQKR
jgi:pantetheine-phosphate adenylyltransferase